MTPTSTIAFSMQIGLHIVGMWPNASFGLLFRLTWVLTIVMIQTGQYWWIVIHFGNEEMSRFMDGLSVTTEYTVMTLKLVILWLNSR